MDDWQFGPAQELRRAFILDDNKLGPIQWYRPGKSAAVVMSVDDIPELRKAPMKAAATLKKAH